MAKRRTKKEMQVIRQAIYDVLEQDHPMTVRQVFYRLTVLGVEETPGPPPVQADEML